MSQSYWLFTLNIICKYAVLMYTKHMHLYMDLHTSTLLLLYWKVRGWPMSLLDCARQVAWEASEILSIHSFQLQILRWDRWATLPRPS